jgi:hypothetical protein
MGADEAEIRRLLEGQFAALCWNDGSEPDWAAFAAGFVDGAPFYPAVRPVQARRVEEFLRRMDALRNDGRLRSFAERPLGLQVIACRNVAVALAGCEMTENGSAVTRDVNAVLLVKDEGGWRIAAQAWNAVPPDDDRLPVPGGPSASNPGEFPEAAP